MFDAIQVAYWLALSTWFGGVLFVAIAAPIIFRTIREADPTLPKVLSVNLDREHSTLLAGTIVGNLLSFLSRVELICAGVMLLAIIGQWFLIDHSGANLLLPVVRLGMYIAAVVLVIYDWRVVSPRIYKAREDYIDHADEPDVANAAKDEFDKYHKESVTVLSTILFLLLGIILFSANIRPNVMTISIQ